uniref:Uncharacterized protein n=1 Tax=Tetranychus urticae TaxID=32264 RepID=T1KTQ7_TETUR
MIPPMIRVLTIFLIFPAFHLVNGQSNISAVSPSSESYLQKLCLNVDEYKSMFASILDYNSAVNRNTIARMITWVDWYYKAYNRYKWVVDFAIGALTTFSVFLPGGPLIPIVTKVIISLAMNPNMRRSITESMYEVWAMIPPSGSDQYDVAMENSVVIVRQLAVPTARML